MIPSRPPTRLPALLVVGFALLFGVPAAALASEIVFMDPETCTETTVHIEEVASETWTEVKYKEVGGRGPELSVPTALVVDIRRDPQTASQQVKDLENAIGELRRGNLAEARRTLKILSGGGYKQNLESGQMEYSPFTANDPPGRRTRPAWSDEYAHFFYAKALFLEGEAKDDKELLGHAYLALVDQPVPGGEKDEEGNPKKTGGFLQRFATGNSRWYGEAMDLAARALAGLGRYDEAEKAFKALSDAALAQDIGPQWAYAAKLGPGRIAEEQGKYLEAIRAYTDAANFMRLLLPREVRGCFRKMIGRLYSRGRMEAARVMLQRAEKNKSPAELAELRNFIEASTPEALARQFASLPDSQRQALVEGALDPQVQSVMQNGLGFTYLLEEKFEEAVLAFRSVEVKYFQVPEEHARALHYLALAAEGASKKASEEAARKLYASYRDEARRRLKTDHPDSPWAKGI